jgi:hypothetical protein
MVARLIRPLDTDAQSWSLDITWLDPQFLPYDRGAYWRGLFSIDGCQHWYRFPSLCMAEESLYDSQVGAVF